MGIIRFRIYFNSPQPVYYCGETINGRIELELSSFKKVNGISLTVKGEANTSWSETTTIRHNEKEERVTTYYSGHESYFNRKYWLVGGNGNQVQLAAGSHVYPFSTTLPDNIPSSFEGTDGYVRYTIKTTLDRPWKFDHNNKVAFTVLTQLDLNLIPRLREPAALIMEKIFSCCTCSSGGLTVIVKAPCTGFVCGQIIPLVIEIDNASSENIASTTIKFTKYVTFYSTNRRNSKSYSVTLRKWNINKTVKSKEADLYSLNVEVPAIPPSNMINCRIIDISYSFRFNFLVSGLHRNLRGNLPIIIGTVPLRNMIPMRQPTVDRSSAPEGNETTPSAPEGSEARSSATAPPSYDSIEKSSRPVGWMPAPPGSPDVYDILPPTYEESEFGTKNILDKSDSQYTMLDNRHYAPMYPVYSFNMPLIRSEPPTLTHI